MEFSDPPTPDRPHILDILGWDSTRLSVELNMGEINMGAKPEKQY